LLDFIRALVRAKRGTMPATFSRRELREACGWSLTQVRVHLERLVELEYLELRHGRLGSSFVYELMLDANTPEAVAHIGLIDVETLRASHGYGGKVAGFALGVRAKTAGWGGWHNAAASFNSPDKRRLNER